MCTKPYKTYQYKFRHLHLNYLEYFYNQKENQKEKRWFWDINDIILKHPNPIASLPRSIPSLLGLFCSSALCLALPSADPRVDFSKWISNCPCYLAMFVVKWTVNRTAIPAMLIPPEGCRPYSAGEGTALPCSCCSTTEGQKRS